MNAPLPEDSRTSLLPRSRTVPPREAHAWRHNGRRGAVRYDIAVDVELTIGSKRHFACTRQLSFGGAFVAAAVRPACGSRVTLRFVVPSPYEIIETGGVVRYSD